ncbi:MAG: universal stress protein [Sphingobacteriia bacterium]|nr:universal stress protein [Sphingobacteriia bacterium]NCC40462.1 universal stress protein [Gammaproteobacteria bacterium]
MFKHILVPTDGSELSRESAKRAIQFAKSVGAQVTALYVSVNADLSMRNEGDLIDPAALDHLTDGADPGSDKRAKEYLGFVKKLCKEKGVECHTIVTVDNQPNKSIVDTALQHGCDLIFMASHGLGGMRSLLLGSETQKVLVHSGIPVLVYRSQTKEKSRRKKG